MDQRGYLQKTAIAGFALPTILIASVVMIIVMLVAIQSTVSVRVALDDQYYAKLAQEGGEAGVAFAKACFALNAGKPSTTWTANQSRTLRPDTNCDGVTVGGASKYLFNANGIRTSFTVTYPTVDSTGVAVSIPSSGKVELLRSSNALPWRTQTQPYIKNVVTENFVSDAFPVGTSLDGYWATPPLGYLFENGAAVSRTVYSDLFSLIGTTYGAGDGSTTFNLPDSRGRVGVNISSSDTQFDTMGEKYGEKAHTLTTTEMPAHSHSGTTGVGNAFAYRLVYQGSSSGAASNHFLGYGGTSTWIDRGDTNWALSTHTHNFTTNATGSGTALNVTQPSIVKLSVIKYSPPLSTASPLPAGTSISGYWASAPSGYLNEDGTSYSTGGAYADLFAAIGYTYGGSGGSFNVPDSRGRVGVNISTDTEFDTMGEKYGEKTHAPTLGEMAAHNHTGTTGAGNSMFYRTVHTIGTNTASNQVAGWAGGSYADLTTGSYPLASHTHNFTTSSNGSGTAFNVIQPSIVKRSVIKLAAADPTATLKIGASVATYGTSGTPPTGFLFEDGSARSRTTYADLFAAIGTKYGAGDGSTTFNLPDSRGRVAVNLSSDSEFSSLGELYGEKTHIMTIAELPSHTHSGTTGSGNAIVNYRTVGLAGSASAGNHVVGWGAGSPFTDRTDANYQGAAHTHNFTTNTVGSSTAFNVIQPSIVKRYMIKYN